MRDIIIEKGERLSKRWTFAEGIGQHSNKEAIFLTENLD